MKKIKTFIIAEAGVNHNGDIAKAKKLIDAAIQAGVDAVKFQTFKAETLVTQTAPKAEYQIKNMGTNESQQEMLKKLELPEHAFKELFEYCQANNIIFMSTAFDEKSADMLEAIGMNIFKIPSGEITNKSLIQHIALKNKKIILSTGMSSLGEVEKAIYWINEIWDKSINRPELILLHCVSNYPASFENTNLRAIKTLKKAFGFSVGFSDHSLGIEVPIAAVALGAEVIEKHLTLGNNMAGPDHAASLEPDKFKDMVAAIRNIEKAIGNGVKNPVKNELPVQDIARKSLITRRDIKAGTIISADDITIKRPGTGIPPEFKEKIIGMMVEKDIKTDSVITWADFHHA